MDLRSRALSHQKLSSIKQGKGQGKLKNQGDRSNTSTPSTGQRPYSSLPGRRKSNVNGGKLVLGSTRPLTAVSNLRSTVRELRENLETAHSSLEMQKVEISHLQEGVNV